MLERGEGLMWKRQSIFVSVLILCFFLLLVTPAGAAGSDPRGLAFAISLDSSGEMVGAEIAVIAHYTDGTYVDAPASLVSSKAASYQVLIDGKTYPMRYDSTVDAIAIAEFTVDDPNNSLRAPGAGIASKDEQVTLVYYYDSGDTFAVGTAEVQVTDYLDMGNGVVLYDFEQLGSLKSDFRFPMSVTNASGQIVAYMAQTDSGAAMYTYVFDAAGFSGGDAAQPNNPAQPDHPAQPNSPANPGRDPVNDDPVPNQNHDVMYAVIGAAAVAAAGVVFFFVRRKKGGANTGGSAAPADVFYPPTAPADVPPTAPSDIPSAVPSYQTPAPPKKVSPVVYGEGGEMDGRRYAITQPTMTIGREKSCNICYSANSPGISHQHCLLAMRNGVLMLIDNGSTYGTYLRGTGKLTPQQPVALKDGDVFYLGEKKNAFRLTFE